ncbi:hypothetical protein [Streptomyces sp. NPDC001828]|uniref:hypothetical protein n=1 Tax=Streptomyces sp. NPDC001828 TaxID=3364615 RepID=UPI0036925E4C
MLNERTADVAVTSPSEEPVLSGITQKLRTLEDFLAKFPNIPEPYVTIQSGALAISLQLSEFEATPQKRCLAVALIAQELGSAAHLNPIADWWAFETDVVFGGLGIQVYAPVQKDAGAHSDRADKAAV